MMSRILDAYSITFIQDDKDKSSGDIVITRQGLAFTYKIKNGKTSKLEISQYRPSDDLFITEDESIENYISNIQLFFNDLDAEKHEEYGFVHRFLERFN
ncbi:Uncharacterised protein [Candidatus Tiddalikarchaeum anstoanum]|nr:Uncharacterised protein [Candidatus Tiddalikarchaeum anstoanum]